MKACNADPSGCIKVIAQRGGQNQRSTEFQKLDDRQVKEAYDAAKGEARVKLQRELKARGLHGGGKVRGGGIFRGGPLLIVPAIDTQMQWFNCIFNIHNDPSCTIA